LGFDYTIHYKAGASNIVADALSRAPSSPGQLLLLSVPHLEFIEDLRRTLHDDPQFQALLSKVQEDPSAHMDCRVHNELIFFQGRIWLPRSNPYIPTILLEYHATPLRGHVGVAKTSHRLASSFFWAGLKEDVKHFIWECTVCQQTKASTCRLSGLLQPLPALTGIWEDISMDFITHLPAS